MEPGRDPWGTVQRMEAALQHHLCTLTALCVKHKVTQDSTPLGEPLYRRLVGDSNTKKAAPCQRCGHLIATNWNCSSRNFQCEVKIVYIQVGKQTRVPLSSVCDCA